MKRLAVVDNFMQTPVHLAFNHLVERTGICASYHMLSQYGTQSLKALKHKPDAIILLGSASHVTERLPWHKELLDWCIPLLEAGTPTLGICFGHQLLADYYGCEVNYLSETNECFQEARKISFKEKFWDYTPDETSMFAYSHAQAVKKLGPLIKSIASSHRCEHEIIKHEKYPFIGIQAHPEASSKFMSQDANINDINEQNTIKANGELFLDRFLRFAGHKP